MYQNGSLLYWQPKSFASSSKCIGFPVLKMRLNTLSCEIGVIKPAWPIFIRLRMKYKKYPLVLHVMKLTILRYKFSFFLFPFLASENKDFFPKMDSCIVSKSNILQCYKLEREHFMGNCFSYIASFLFLFFIFAFSPMVFGP